ncbi:MAG: P-loop NTPase [Deltaproteobacteria bacterium]|nr:P-loop NTPase [Deltaproteobacteria bacterium]
MTTGPKKRVVAVGGGKGGVGKSFVVANLAATLAMRGTRVVALDADLGAANLHSLFGIGRPPRTIEDFLERRVGSLAELVLPTSVPGLSLICGASQVLGSASPRHDAKQRLIAELAHLDTDCLLVDVGAGTDINQLDFFNAADIRLVVMTPEITSVQNGYGFLKMALFRRLQRAVTSGVAASRLAKAFGGRAFEVGSSMESVSTFLMLLEEEAPELGEPFRLLLREFNAKFIGNMLAAERDRDVIFAVKRMTERFLGLQTEVVASLRADPRVRSSVNRGRPIVLDSVPDANATEIAGLARTLMTQDLTPIYQIRAAVSRALSTADQAFEFGLESVNLDAPAPPPLPAEAQAGPLRPTPSREALAQVAEGPTASFLAELERFQRSSARLSVSHFVQVQLGGPWLMGTLVQINAAGACIAGVRVSPGQVRGPGAFRLVSARGGGAALPAVSVELHSYDESTGRVVVRFTDPQQASSLVGYLRQATPS